ncbi:MAG: hypothetical protein KDK39_12470 [Leptospiraceae bacterium]|nr:hypothetical protein [Leptospiraceae bacterium]
MNDPAKKPLILHLALTMGILVFGLVLFVMERQGGLPPGNPELQSAFEIVIPIVVVLSYLAAWFFFQRLLQKAATVESEEQAAVILSAVIVRAALIEGSAFLAGVAFLLTHQPVFLAVMAINLLLMLALLPTPDRIQAHLQRARPN